MTEQHLILFENDVGIKDLAEIRRAVGMKEAEIRPAVQEQWLEVDGLGFHCFVAGTSGSPVVLLHGGGLDSASISWRACIGPLATQHRVFAPDLPGYGQSDKPEVEYTLEFYVQFLDHLLDALQLQQVSLVGLSLGGGIALGFTLRFPARVEKLVLDVSEMQESLLE